MINHTSRSLQDVIRSAVEQYQVSLGEPPNLTPLFYREYTAELGGGLRISVLQNKPRDLDPAPSSQPGDNSLVSISDRKLIEDSKSAVLKIEAEKKEEFRRNNPLPKY